ncbi:hypothetical protein DX928_20680 [Bacillus swezeyi]|uniref:Uncharacterized protein n=1 Tax=Bacillus swezeyi TaxID=1925020 RepID=A0A5M8RZ01_9BACI|nr:hypothetical protein DX927_15280 [Bacillus swezeyi]KAA6473740.1 hypothetical protein DX928_20680 [Bacillus swezeyi]
MFQSLVVLVTVLVSGLVLLLKAIFGESVGMAFLVMLCVLCLWIAKVADRRAHTIASYFKELLICVKGDK